MLKLCFACFPVTINSHHKILQADNNCYNKYGLDCKKRLIANSYGKCT